MAFRTLSTDSQFTTNIALPIFRPAVAAHLELTAVSPSDVYATTHHSNFTAGGKTFTGVGATGYIEITEATLEGAATRAKIGLVGLPMETLTPATENDLIGKRAHIYQVAFDAEWANPGLQLWFSGYIDGAETQLSPQESGDVLVNYFLNLSDRASPRRRLTNNHAAGNGAAGDTAQNLMFTIKKSYRWPES